MGKPIVRKVNDDVEVQTPAGWEEGTLLTERMKDDQGRWGYKVLIPTLDDVPREVFAYTSFVRTAKFKPESSPKLKGISDLSMARRAAQKTTPKPKRKPVLEKAIFRSACDFDNLINIVSHVARTGGIASVPAGLAIVAIRRDYIIKHSTGGYGVRPNGRKVLTDRLKRDVDAVTALLKQ